MYICLCVSVYVCAYLCTHMHMDMEDRRQYHSLGTIYSLFKERFTIFDRVYLCVDVYL